MSADQCPGYDTMGQILAILSGDAKRRARDLTEAERVAIDLAHAAAKADGWDRALMHERMQAEEISLRNRLERS
jgi:hypothetical protein